MNWGNACWVSGPGTGKGFARGDTLAVLAGRRPESGPARRNASDCAGGKQSQDKQIAVGLLKAPLGTVDRFPVARRRRVNSLLWVGKRQRKRHARLVFRLIDLAMGDNGGIGNTSPLALKAVYPKPSALAKPL